MDEQGLIRKANQIADFFEGFPEHSEAIEGVLTHLKKFWEPRMRRQLLAMYAARAEALELRPLVREVLDGHQEALQ